MEQYEYSFATTNSLQKKHVTFGEDTLEIITIEEGLPLDLCFREIIVFSMSDGYCITSYTSYKGHLPVEKWDFKKDSLFCPNMRAPEYMAFSTTNAFVFVQLLFLFHDIVQQNKDIFLYNSRNYSFSKFLYKKILSYNSRIERFKFILPFMGVAEYSLETNLLVSFKSDIVNVEFIVAKTIVD